jgi:hypothetical protein
MRKNSTQLLSRPPLNASIVGRTMTDFRCPHCTKVAEIVSSEIGGEVSCPTCRRLFRADDATLARFEIPPQMRIMVRTVEGKAWMAGRPVLLASRGDLVLPPLRTNSDGEFVLTRQMFSEAVDDAANAAIMDFKNDYRLVRYLEVKVLSKSEGRRLAKARGESGWPIQRQEAEMYRTLPALLDAFVPSDAPDVQACMSLIDLERPAIEIELRVQLGDAAAEPRVAAGRAAPGR